MDQNNSARPLVVLAHPISAQSESDVVVRALDREGFEALWTSDPYQLFEAISKTECFCVFISDKFHAQVFKIIKQGSSRSRAYWILIAHGANKQTNLRAVSSGATAVLGAPVRSAQYVLRARQMLAKFQARADLEARKESGAIPPTHEGGALTEDFIRIAGDRGQSHAVTKFTNAPEDVESGGDMVMLDAPEFVQAAGQGISLDSLDSDLLTPNWESSVGTEGGPAGGFSISELENNFLGEVSLESETDRSPLIRADWMLDSNADSLHEPRLQVLETKPLDLTRAERRWSSSELSGKVQESLLPLPFLKIQKKHWPKEPQEFLIAMKRDLKGLSQRAEDITYYLADVLGAARLSIYSMRLSVPISPHPPDYCLYICGPEKATLKDPPLRVHFVPHFVEAYLRHAPVYLDRQLPLEVDGVLRPSPMRYKGSVEGASAVIPIMGDDNVFAVAFVQYEYPLGNSQKMGMLSEAGSFLNSIRSVLSQLDFVHRIYREHFIWKKQNFSRFRLRLPMDFRVGEFSDSQAVLQEVGEGGAFIATAWDSPKVGQEYDFELRFQWQQPLVLKGRLEVRWVRSGQIDYYKPGIGLRFLGWENESRLPFLSFVEALRQADEGRAHQV